MNVQKAHALRTAPLQTPTDLRQPAPPSPLERPAGRLSLTKPGQGTRDVRQ